MKWKTVVIGGLAYFAVTWVVGFVTGQVIHNGILVESYQAHSQFWRPELNQNPPDMAALMPYWITTGLLGALVFAGLYGCFRAALSGPGWKRGLVFGFCLAIFQAALMAGWSGVFNLPANIWIWWALEGFAYYVLGGAVLGLVSAKLDPHD